MADNSKVLRFPVPPTDPCSVAGMLEELPKRKDDIEALVAIVYYKDGRTATWRSIMTDRDFAYGLAILQYDFNQSLGETCAPEA